MSSKGAIGAYAVGAVLVTLVSAILAVDIHGFSIQNLFAQHIWDTVGLQRLARFTGLFLAAAVPILALAPWSFPRVALGLVALGTLISVGPLPLIAVTLFLVSSCTLGMKVLHLGEAECWESHLLATLTGVGLYVAVMTLLAYFPVNYPVVWGALLVAPILVDWRSVRRRARYWGTLLSSMELRPWPTFTRAAGINTIIWLNCGKYARCRRWRSYSKNGECIMLLPGGTSRGRREIRKFSGTSWKNAWCWNIRWTRFGCRGWTRGPADETWVMGFA